MACAIAGVRLQILEAEPQAASFPREVSHSAGLRPRAHVCSLPLVLPLFLPLFRPLFLFLRVLRLVVFSLFSRLYSSIPSSLLLFSSSCSLSFPLQLSPFHLKKRAAF